MVEHWYSVVYVADHRCATIIQIHHLSVKFLNVPHCIRTFKEPKSTGSEKDPSTGQDIQERFINGFTKTFFIYLQKKLSNSYPMQKISFQVVADEKRCLSIVVLKWQPAKISFLCVLRLYFFKMHPQVVADGIDHLGSDLRKNPSQWQPTRKAFLEAFQEKIQKNNSAQVGQNFENQLPDKLSGIKNDLQPSWSEVQNPTSAQPGQKLKITSPQFAEK